ncbi:glycosyltransferase family 2 protein [Sporosarcina sp. A2]|uniref:glycosyltransferase family 2 protein n=1 Tax=Sporosarcina sp. A2 TaxID=3393449 RepID=UPI003D79FD96
MPLLSIIVPIFKIEKYLPRCIDSILRQPFNDYELILVNDGSPDACPSICNQYAESDNRIKVIHKKNGGLSDARNAGIENAKGRYLLFIDGDDYMKDFTLEKIMKPFNGSEDLDMLICPLIKTYPTGEEKVDYLPLESNYKLLNQKEMLAKMTISKTTFWGAGKNIYKNSIIKDKKLFFQKDLIGAEDCEFFMKYIRSCRNFYLINIPIVHYRLEREGSITNVMSMSAITGQLHVFYDNFYFYKYENQYVDSTMQVFFANKFANTVSLLYNLKNKADYSQVIAYLNHHKNILKYTNNLKYSIAKVVWSILGFYKGSILLRKLNSYKKGLSK